MARRDAEPGPDLDPLRGGLKHNPFASLKPRTSSDAGAQGSPAEGSEARAAAGKSAAPRATGPRPTGDERRVEPVSARKSGAPPEAPARAPAVRSAERVIVRRERKGRGGKAVTFAEGPGLAGFDLEELARDAARALGTGARVEDGALLVQGEQSERLIAWLESRGCKSVARGN